jgi:hypothetical protein
VHIVKYIIYKIYNIRLKYFLNRKIFKIYNTIRVKDKIDKRIIAKHRQLWGQIGTRPNIKWLSVYIAISGINDYRYISEYDYYAIVEPKLNCKGLSEAHSDKNMYHRFLPAQILPRVLLRNINGVCYTEQYSLIENCGFLGNLQNKKEKIIIKNSLDTGGGYNVQLFQLKSGIFYNSRDEELNQSYLDRVYDKNYLIQEYITQHPYFQKFNPSSLNTVRIYTYRSIKSNKSIPIQAVLRIGRSGAVVDNQAAGGIAVGIKEFGKLNDYGVNKNGEKINIYNGIHFTNVGPVPYYDKIIDLAISLSEYFVYHRVLGFDVCLDKDGNIKLIEVNIRNNEINFFQMSNGPLFGDYTDEIIEYCKTHRITFSIDYEI